MLKKRDFVFYAVIGYLVLIMLFFFYREERDYSFYSYCTFQSGCIRFCCRNSSTCNEKFIRNNFNASTEDGEFEYKIIYGEPRCPKKLIEDRESWTFFEDGDVHIDRWYNHEKYCFQDSTIGNSVSFNLFICESREHLADLANIFVLITTVLLLATTIIAFVFIKELRVTMNSKIEIFLLLSLLCTCASLSIVQIEEHIYMLRIAAAVSFGISFIVSLLWMTVLMFDVWWTTRKGGETSDGAERFKFYCYFVCGVVGVIIVWGLFEAFVLPYRIPVFQFILSSILILNFLFEIAFIVMTAVDLIRKAKSTSFLDHEWFEVQKDRFWTNIQVFMIFILNSFMLYFSLFGHYFGYESAIILEAIVWISAILLFMILLLSKETRKLFFESYGKLQNSENML